MSGTPRRDFLRNGALGLASLNVGARALAAGKPRVHLASGTARSPGLRGATRLRGLMVDAARLPEPVSYYRRLIDFCHEWQVNALLVRLTDDQGAALRFQSHPELVTHRHALTLDEARDLAAYGEQRGVTLIPEIESFGHTRYITGVARYEHLEDRDPAAPSGFTGLSPVAP